MSDTTDTLFQLTRFKSPDDFRNIFAPIPTDNSLTIIVRADSKFATTPIINEYSGHAAELTGRSATLDEKQFSQLVRNSYKGWATDILNATTSCLNYQGIYGLSPTTKPTVHIFSSNQLAGDVMKKACTFITRNYPEKSDVLFVSLDDMIHGKVFDANAVIGEFDEIGFSRIFSRTGEEQGFVGRPGKPDLDVQIAVIKEHLEKLHKNGQHRIPIILLEDNVRRAKTLNWIFAQMAKGGVFEHGKMVGVATCFSVATPEEKEKIVCEGEVIPLIIGADYSGKTVDVITPRDHMFDGFVVKANNGALSRLPSFALPVDQIASNFKIAQGKASSFLSNVIRSNLGFCDKIKEIAGFDLPLGWFPSGQVLSDISGAEITTPMRNVIRHFGSLNTPHNIA